MGTENPANLASVLAAWGARAVCVRGIPCWGAVALLESDTLRDAWLQPRCVSPWELAFFVYGFAKSGRENLRPDELETFRLLADEYLALDRTGLSAATAVGAIIEVQCDDQAVQEQSTGGRA